MATRVMTATEVVRLCNICLARIEVIEAREDELGIEKFRENHMKQSGTYFFGLLKKYRPYTKTEAKEAFCHEKVSWSLNGVEFYYPWTWKKEAQCNEVWWIDKFKLTILRKFAMKTTHTEGSVTIDEVEFNRFARYMKEHELK